MSIKGDREIYYVLAVIHARGGSKRIPLKNIKHLFGKPLIAYCIEAAKKSKYIDNLIVSTDHDKIKAVALQYGAEVPFKRPDDISEDVASELVTKHALDFMEKQDDKIYQVVVTVQPTTPFLQTEDIDKCIEKLVATPETDTVMTGYEMRELPTWARQIKEDGFSENIFGKISKGDHGISQKQPKFYMGNGGAYATRRKVLADMEMIVGPKTMIHLMPYERSIDIDEPIDFFIAEKLVELKASGRSVEEYVLNR